MVPPDQTTQMRCPEAAGDQRRLLAGKHSFDMTAESGHTYEPRDRLE